MKFQYKGREIETETRCGTVYAKIHSDSGYMTIPVGQKNQRPTRSRIISAVDSLLSLEVPEES